MIEPAALIREIRRFIAGDDASGDRICASLESPIRTAVHRFLSPDDADGDDVVQDVLVALLGYLRRAGTAPDNPEAFAVTMTRNRCINLHLWRKRRAALDVDEMAHELPHVAASPLEMIDAEENRALLSETLDSLDERCRELLEAIYRRGASIESLRRRLGLGSVQAVYHRRNICLKNAQRFLNRRLFDCRPVRGRPAAAAVERRGNEGTRDG